MPSRCFVRGRTSPLAALSPFAVLLVACSAPPLRPDDPTALSTPERAVAAVPESLALHGPLGWLHHCDADDFVMASDGGVKFASFEAMRAAMLQFGPTVRTMRLVWRDPEVRQLTAELASFGSAYEERIEAVDETVSEFHGYVSGVLARTADGWRFRRLHWSQPVSETAIGVVAPNTSDEVPAATTRPPDHP